MCPQCRRFFRIWATGNKTRGEVDFLNQEVPKRFIVAHRYFDDKKQTMVYVLECNCCEQAFHVPH